MRFIDKDGNAEVLVISPGQGTSAYYEGDQLARDVGTFKGGLVFIDHPTRREASERPERSLKDLAASVIGIPEYKENGREGPGLYSKVHVVDHWRPFVEAIGPAVSLNAGGKATTKVINGKKTRVAESFNNGASFDFVTAAGRGGKTLRLSEAQTALYEEASERGRTSENAFMESAGFQEGTGDGAEGRYLQWIETAVDKESEMELKEALQKLTTAEDTIQSKDKLIETLTKERDDANKEIETLRETAVASIAKDRVRGLLGKSELPTQAQERLLETLTKKAPIENGVLDTAKFDLLVEAGIKAEKEYLESIGAKQTTKQFVSGLGPSDETGNDDGHEARVKTRAAYYLREGKAVNEAEATRMAEIFYS